MKYADAQTLADSFKTTHWIIKKQTDGLTHEDSLLQLPFRGNCLNWVLGHIIASRNSALTWLEQEPVWDEVRASRYGNGSEPITSGDDAVRLEEMLADLDRSQERILAGLEAITDAALERMVPWGKGEQSVAEILAFLHWHETYHTGQLEILRQLAGTNDAII
jgi:uncharacterized damage-inducible protein DinB